MYCANRQDVLEPVRSCRVQNMQSSAHTHSQYLTYITPPTQSLSSIFNDIAQLTMYALNLFLSQNFTVANERYLGHLSGGHLFLLLALLLLPDPFKTDEYKREISEIA